MSETTSTPSTLIPYDLRCEHLETPLGIETTKPRLSWRLRSDHRGATPRRVRVTVTGPAGSWDRGWTPDYVQELEYTGDLQARTRYQWQLDVEDTEGTTVRATSWFETGLMDRSEVVGSWIARNPVAPDVRQDFDPPVDDNLTAKVRHIPPAINVRGQFTIERHVDRVRVYATAHGIYRLYLNGERISDTEMAPGWTDYRDRVLYQAYDVTDTATTGTNVIGMTVADGWWSGYVGFDSRRQGNHYGEYPEAWAMVVTTYTDGTESVFCTDDTWQESPGAIVYSDLLMGEYVDRQRDLGNWTSPSYDSSSWGKVRIVGTDLTTLAAPCDPPVRVLQEVPAKAITRDPNGRLIVDFGQNVVGWVRVSLGAMAVGNTVYIRHGEILDGEYLHTDNLRTAEARDVYVSAGQDTNIMEPSFTFHGFRYAEISGAVGDLSVQDITACALYSDTPEVGALTTSSADVNQLISNIRWGQRSNFVSIPTDCPQRDERLGWTADAQVFLPTAALNADVQALMARWLGDVRYAQNAEGSFPDVAPIVSQFFQEGAPAWGDGGVIMPWHLYRVYGDKRLLADSFASMRAWVDFIHRNNPDLIWTRRTGKHYGDWLQIDASTSRHLLATAYFAHSTELVAKSAQVLGDEALFAQYSQLAADIKAAFVATFLQADGTLESDTQTCYLLALAFSLVPDDLRPAMGDHLVSALERHSNLLTTGFVGVSLLCPVLSEIGRSDLAYGLLETDQFPSWLYSIRQGATTIWERWDGWTTHKGFQSVEMNSFNHYSLGSVGEWLYRYAAGIDQTEDSVAYSHPLIRPQLGGTLTHASAQYETPFGLLASGWQVGEGDRATFTFTIPPGTTATVQLPLVRGTEGETELEAVSGVSDVRLVPEGVAFTAAAGTYTIDGVRK